MKKHACAQRGQSLLEYILVISAVIITILAFVRPGGGFWNALYNAGGAPDDSILEKAHAKVDAIAGKIKDFNP